MRFKNLKSGNIVSTDSAETIALMKGSPNYEAVSEKKGKTKTEKSEDSEKSDKIEA